MPFIVEPARAALARGVRSLGALALGPVIAVCAASAALAQTAVAPLPAPAKSAMPSFLNLPSNIGWVRIRTDGRNALYGDGWLDPPAGLRGPIRDDPGHPLQGNVDRGAGRQVTLAMGNFADPILEPWAAEAMRQSNEEVLTGKRGMPFLATSRC